MDKSSFDKDKGTVRNNHGKVIGKDVGNGLYVCGWLKRGPSGIIGSNIMDAKDTVATIIKDWINEEGKIQQEYTTWKQNYNHGL